MEIRDFWDEIRTVFEGQSDQINEIDLIKITDSGMAQCLHYLLNNAKDCSTRFTIRGSETRVTLLSPQSVIDNVLMDHVSVAMWLTFPAIPMLSIYIDFSNEISFGYVRGAWNAMATLAFFDLVYELRSLSPGSELRPGPYTYTPSERTLIMNFWQDYT